MFLDYIAIILSALYLVLAVISVIIEAADASPRRSGDVSRSMRCHLRDITFAPFITIVCVFIILSAMSDTSDIKRILLAALIFFAGVLVLHSFKSGFVLRSRRLKKNSSAARLRRTKLLPPSKRRETPVCKELVQLAPMSEQK